MLGWMLVYGCDIDEIDVVFVVGIGLKFFDDLICVDFFWFGCWCDCLVLKLVVVVVCMFDWNEEENVLCDVVLLIFVNGDLGLVGKLFLVI